VLDKSALAEQDAELEALRKKNRQLAERLRNVEIHVVAKAQAQNRTVPYGDRPSKTRPYAVGIHTPAEIASGKGGSRASSSERRQIEAYGVSATRSVSGTPRTAARGSSVGALPPPVPGGSGGGGNTSIHRSPGGGGGGLDSTNAETRILTEQRDAARAEADSLRRQMSLQLATSSATSSAAGNASFSQLPVGSGNTVAVPRGDLLEMERQLKDRTSQVLLLKSRYEHLESRSAAERELYDRAVAALEEQNSQIRDARSSLQQAEADISLLRSRLRAQEDNDAELRIARDEVRRMERQLTDLCESPFISDGRERLGKAEKLEDLQKENAALREQVSHLQHSVKSQHIEITSLRREKRELTDSNESLKEQSGQSRQLAEAAQRANATLRERLALYSGVVGGMDGTASAGTAIEGGPAVSSSSSAAGVGGSNAIPPEELERALAIVRRRMDTPASDSASGQKSSNSDSADSTDPSSAAGILRRKVQQLQLALLSTQRDLERSEAMLRAQSSISSDLSAEVAELNERISTETGSIRRRLADTEAVAEKRLQRTSMLEAQVKQLLQKLRDVTEAFTSNKAALEEALIAAKESAETRAVDDATGAASTVVASSRKQSSASRGALSPRAIDDGVNDDDDDASTVISDLSGDDERAGPQTRNSMSNKRGGQSSSSSSAASSANGAAIVVTTNDDEATEDDSLGELLDFGPGEDAIEIYIIDATIDPSSLGRHDTTFALLDFLDFDSQTSPLSNGTSPIYNFSAAYRVETTQAFLHSIASQGATIDINQAKGADFELLARAVVPLYDFLLPSLPSSTSTSGGAGAPAPKPTTRLKFASLPLVHKNGRVIGSLRVEARIAVPLTELWAQFNRERPAEGASLTQQIREKQRTSNASGGVNTAITMDPASSSSSSAAAVITATEFSGHKPNELLVTVVGASDLSSSSRRGPPSTFVQFNLPGMQTAATSVVSSNSNPVYADQRVFPLVPNARQLQTLGSTPLVFSVIDDAAASAAAATGSSEVGSAVIGKATVSLASVAEGGSIDSSYDITDAKGQITGRLHVRIGWSRPLSTVDGAPPGTLHRAQLHALSAVFDRDGAGVKHELLARALLMSENDANALDRVRKAIDAHEQAIIDASASSSSTSSRRASVGSPVKWSTALKTAAEACGRPGLTLSPKEVFNSITLPAVSGMSIDFSSVENALLGLLPPLKEGESSSDDKLPVSDIIDAFSPLVPLAQEAFLKLRRFAASLPKGKGQPRLDWALEDEADEAAKLVFKTDRPTRAQAERLSRAGVISALKKIGIMVVDDAALERRSSSISSSSTAASRAMEKAASEKLTAAVAAAVAIEMPGRAAGSGVTVRIASREEEVAPSIVSAAVANAAYAANSSVAAAGASSAVVATSATVGDQTTTATTQRRASAKELVFEDTSSNVSSTTASATTATATATTRVAETIITPSLEEIAK
jgi:hypothetical protein